MATYENALITEDELSTLTGYEPNQVERQKQWLDRNGVPYTLRRDGRPRTTLSALDDALARTPSAAREPNLESLRKRSR